MPQLTVLFWNIQTFGNPNLCRTIDVRNHFIAATVFRAQADILLIEEVTQNAIGYQQLEALQRTLNSMPAPLNNWYYDWIKGGLTTHIFPVPPATYPFNQAADLDWDAGHHEGYAMFWNQNIAKFIMQPAPPIQPPGALAASPNTQSEQCRMQGLTAGMVVMPLPGIPVPAGGLQVPVGLNPYTVPAGSNVVGHGAVLAATPWPAGTVLPAGTVIGAGGITLNVQTVNVNPVVVPGNFTLTDNLTLPLSGIPVVPLNALSLVMFGRDSADPLAPNPRPDRWVGDISHNTFNYVHGGANNWNWIEFTQSAFAGAMRTGARRPAYATIKVNRPGAAAAADQLVPIIVYHAPSANEPSQGGMQRSAYGQPMYQAYDTGAGAWIDCNNALLGGDFNVTIDPNNYAYAAFAGAWGMAGNKGGGAAATMAINNPPLPAANNPPNRSIVSLVHGKPPAPRYSAAINDFRQQAIDNIFFRGLNNGVNPVVAELGDLISGVSAGGNMVGWPVGIGLFTPAMQAAAAAAAGGLPFVQANMVSPFASGFQMTAGQFGPPDVGNNTAARRAAEFVNLFVSDHLPAAIRCNM